MTIRNADLLSIASSGLAAQNRLLQTTGNNIANVNTEGYIRERTTFVAELNGGVGRGTTSQILDIFAQNQLRRDTSTYAQFTAYHDKASQLDDIFASEASSLATSMSDFFEAMQTAADEPTNMAARQLVLGQADSLLGRFNSLSEFLSYKEDELNLEFNSMTEDANNLIETIAELNNSIRINQYRNQHDVPGAIISERDNAILKLAEMVDITTRTMEDGSTLVNLKSGQSLVMQDGTFNVFEVNGEPDAKQKNLTLKNSSRGVDINLPENSVGGRIGGLFNFRDDILSDAQRQMGQLALALADAVNQQNRLGMDYDGQLGIDIFNLPVTQALNYSTNSSLSLGLNGRIAEGQSNQVTTKDYQIVIDNVAAGPPSTVDITVNLLEPDGTPVLDVNGNPQTQSFTGLDAAAGTFVPIMDGLEIEFPNGASYAAGDQFLLQPTKYSAGQIEVGIVRPEDIAFASPIRVESDINNLGDATLVSTDVTNVNVGNPLTDTSVSAFDGTGGIHGPGQSPAGPLPTDVGAPAQIVFLSADSYEIRDSAGQLITTVSGASSLENLIQQGAASAGWPPAFAAMDNYPGYDLTLQGVPKAGDVFNINYNTDGFDDNRNGLIMADLQSMDTMRRSASASGGPTNLLTFHESYASLVGSVGEKTAKSDVSAQAAKALVDQSKSWFESVSGVSLDEEAANLMRFQQAYSASARLISTAQDLFNTILSSVR
ncbi:flagellar hook-associated protein FlgK [Neptunicella marina]|uniref:Flagellar hook-associated protein 1 n=1 Tax=Neptunicella marina TaxID=2125989 RepID=A0A8J6IUV9_9ALTE|nr:flagellar hook-associated protein FlgK [Neptunicella marina]MBC3766784.1 flagellar hook-associated protein FlgK [Neptunicella marina]